MGLFSLSFLDYNCDKYCRKRDPSVATAGLNRKLEAEKFWFSLHKQGSVLSFSSPFSFLLSPFYSELKRGGLHHGVWDAGRVMILFFVFCFSGHCKKHKPEPPKEIKFEGCEHFPAPTC